MKLIICEKPSVGIAIASALGIETKKDGYMESEDFLVSWCIGHLAELSEPSCYGKCYEKWSLETLPILPETWQLTVSKDKEKQFSVLKELLFKSDVTEVINACDAGREGELIFRFVMEKAGCKKLINMTAFTNLLFAEQRRTGLLELMRPASFPFYIIIP